MVVSSHRSLQAAALVVTAAPVTAAVTETVTVTVTVTAAAPAVVPGHAGHVLQPSCVLLLAAATRPQPQVRHA